MLAPDGRCKALDAAANGYVRAEDCIAFLLGANPGDTADCSGHAVAVLGSAVNQDGRSSSLTAPNGPSQQQASLHCTALHCTVLCLQAQFACFQPGRHQAASLGPTVPFLFVLQLFVTALQAGRALPSDLGGVEMHGTGTALGDPIEAGAIAAVQQVGTPFLLHHLLVLDNLLACLCIKLAYKHTILYEC